jgi:threonine/homoserine/homoserine lactone efflux protein
MQSIETLLIFSAASIALTSTPGPDMLLIASRTVAQGRTAGFLTLAGVQVGTVVHAIVAALGLSQLMLHVPAIYEMIRWAGAAYLLWLAWKTI